jgi:hypothetical protein
MTNSFRNFRCWRTPVVQETILGDIGMLRLKADAVFLAAHAPVPVERLKGAVAPGEGEAEILNALRSELGLAERNTIIAVTGDVGTGKSHAVRWVRAHLREDLQRYRTIYVPRDVATLRELLNSILASLPGEKARSAQRRLDNAITKKSRSQLMTALTNNLREVLAHELGDQGDGDPVQRVFLLGRRSDHNAKRRDGLADLLLNLTIQDHLNRDGGTVGAVIDSLNDKRSGRDQHFPQFTAGDIPVRKGGIRSKLDPGLVAVWDSIFLDSGPAVDLLNEALQRAVPMTIGLEAGSTLDDVFRDTRQLLRGEGAELILIFEDLALFGLIEDDLFNQFVLQPGDSYCPLRVLFAVTDAKFRQVVPDTVRDRITYHYAIKNLESDGTQDSTLALATFVARYLNNARVGRQAIIAARDNATDDSRETGTWIPNACATRENGQPCRHQDKCFESFGSVSIGPAGQVGLYPYDEVALRRALERLRLTGQLSPRSLVDRVVRDFLVTADPELGDGSFPGEQVQSWFDFTTDRPFEAIVPDGEELAEHDRERLLRARVIWADGDPVNQGIQEAFDLPGQANSAPLERQPLRPAPKPPSHGSWPQPRGVGPVQSLYDWERGAGLPDSEMTEFRTLFHRWVRERIDLNRHLVSAGPGTAQAVLDAIFADVSFVIAFATGRHPGPYRVRFEIPHSPEGLRLLLAARWFAQHGHWDPSDPDRGWDFPRGLKPADLHVELEDWLCDCAEQVEARYLETICRGGSRPAEAVTVLRTAALRILGRLKHVDGPSAVNAIVTTEGRAESWSPEWQVLAQPATEIIQSLDPGLVTEFAAARQGETGEPQVVDAAQLEPAANAAVRDPAAAVAQLRPFPRELSVIERARAGLPTDWQQSIAQERTELLATVRYIAHALGSDSTDVVRHAADFGRQANAVGAFRSRQGYTQFRYEVGLLEGLKDTTSQWLGCEVALSEPHDTAAVFDAQSWATRARTYARLLQSILEAVQETTTDLEQRTAHQVGVNPGELAERVADQMTEVAMLLEQLSHGSPA